MHMYRRWKQQRAVAENRLRPVFSRAGSAFDAVIGIARTR